MLAFDGVISVVVVAVVSFQNYLLASVRSVRVARALTHQNAVPVCTCNVRERHTHRERRWATATFNLPLPANVSLMASTWNTHNADRWLLANMNIGWTRRPSDIFIQCGGQANSYLTFCVIFLRLPLAKLSYKDKGGGHDATFLLALAPQPTPPSGWRRRFSTPTIGRDLI